MNEQVKVGQVWRFVSGYEGTVTRIDGSYVNLTENGCMHLNGYGRPLWSKDWTLVQDVPARHNVSPEATKFDTSAGSVEGTCGCTLKDPFCHNRWGCMGDRALFDKVQYRWRNPETCAFAVSDKPNDPCAVLRASLPTSGEYIETRECGDEWNVGVTAKADLRRKLGTLRSWPLCPVSGEALTLRAEVKRAGWPGRFTALACDPSSKEAINLWTARMHCAGCAGSK